MRMLLAGLVALFFTALPGAPRAQPSDELLPVEQAFALSARIAAPGRIALHWEIAPDYYLYRSRIKAKTAQAGATLGDLGLPDGEKKHDEFLGDVEVYHHAIDATLPYTLADAGARTLTVTITAQGCHETDPKVCYPPHPTTLTLAIPTAAGAASTPSPPNPSLDGEGFGSGSPLEGEGFNSGAKEGFKSAAPLIQLGGARTGATDSGPLPAEQAFVFEAIAAGPTELLARWTMPKGYYLYRDKSAVSLVDGAGVRLAAPRWPPAVDHRDEHFGTVKVYFDQVELPVALAREHGDAQSVTLRAEYQGCQDDGICYPVMTREVSVALPPASANQLAAANAAFVAAPAATQPAALNPPPSQDDNAQRSTPPAPGALGILGALLLALGGGLILNLMPCVLPVLSLKVLGLAQSGESAAKAAHARALIYTAGVLVGVRRDRPGGGRAARGRTGARLGLPAAAAGVRRGAGLHAVRDRLVAVGRVQFRRRPRRGRAEPRQPLRPGRRLLHRRARGGRRQPLHRAVHGLGAGLCVRVARRWSRCWCSSRSASAWRCRSC